MHLLRRFTYAAVIAAIVLGFLLQMSQGVCPVH